MELTEKYKDTAYGMVQIFTENLNAIIHSGALFAYVPIGHIDDLEENDKIFNSLTKMLDQMLKKEKEIESKFL